jgi:hypothetical protein
VANYGQHHAQIKRFLSRVKSFTEPDWRAVTEARVLTSASFGSRSYHTLEIELGSYKEFGIPGANKVIKQAFDDAGIGRRVGSTDAKELGHRQGLVLDALDGLVRSREISAVDFTRAYLPFAERIPVADLGFNSAPKVLAAPETVVGRFATRVLALDAYDWGDAFVISQLVDSIADQDKNDERWALITERHGALPDENIPPLTAALEVLDTVGAEHLLQMSNIYQGMARIISKEDWVEPRMKEHRDQVDAFRCMATRALFALALMNEIDERSFALFYAPFGALIPFESLDVPH